MVSVSCPLGVTFLKLLEAESLPLGALGGAQASGAAPKTECVYVCVCVYFSSLPVKRTLAVSDGGWTGGLEDHFSAEFRPAWADLPWV